MTADQYHLQYLLYTVALDRYLARRIPDYDYERHFGEVYYFFLRGIDPEVSPTAGLFRHRPSRELVDALGSALFGGRG
jgi:exodeoxyribonuclease V beta subunit